MEKPTGNWLYKCNKQNSNKMKSKINVKALVIGIGIIAIAFGVAVYIMNENAEIERANNRGKIELEAQKRDYEELKARINTKIELMKYQGLT